MQCPLCKLEMRITGSRTEVTGDDSPEKRTEVFHVLVLECVNPQCQHPEPVEEKVKIYPQ